MKVAQIIDSLKWGGAQKMVLTLVQQLCERRIPVTVISLSDDADTDIAQQIRALGVTTHHLGGRLLNLGRIQHLVTLLNQESVTLAHTYLTYANIIGVFAARAAGVPVIASLRSAGRDPRHYNPLRYHMETYTLTRMASVVMANGHAIAEVHQQRLGNRPIVVIPNAVALPPLPSAAERQRQRASWFSDPTRPILMSVGRFSPPKGQADLLQAFAQLRERLPQAALVFVGDGETRAAVEAQAGQLGLSDDVRFLGARSDVPALLPLADVFVSPSHWEGLSVALLEALAAGLPIVATKVGDAPRVVSADVGSLVSPKDPTALANALHTLLTHPSRCAAAAQAARSRAASQFGLDTWTNRLLKLYTQVSPSFKEALPRE
ncbi:glycosyltransferase [Levilinea saccharolytica]|uniref:glycosyltransferase n=1 Tax=Levilinea saccharolytica TaxID=229921 RepID=UPI000780CE52|nr:glycosyltransferase [Levilinea saccharolytica]GAP17881.1 glycosyltransferase [Levilinea saccharolytica]